MKTLIFDVDDTVYDQLEPFKFAFEENFNYTNIPIDQLFLLSRKFSDKVFNLSESGKMSMQDMHIYRIQKALEQYDKKITQEEAIKFQKDYQYFQSNIKLIPDIEKTLYYCVEKNIQMGIITNGPKEHQESKIRQLQLSKWIPEENIIISSAVGFAKPDLKIFKLAESRMNLDKRNTYYVGDSYENDVIGARKAGWKVIWSNRRNHKKPNKMEEYDYLINEQRSLYELVKNKLNSHI